MKKISKIILGLTIFLIIIGFCPNVKAASGIVAVYYHDELLAKRKDTYTYTKEHMGSIGYLVAGYNNKDNSLIYEELTNDKILVMHTHGGPGQVDMGNNTCLIGKNLGVRPCSAKAVANMPYSASQLKIAIYYGCKTGLVGADTGNLPLETVNKGAQASIAWTIDTRYVIVNEWNRLFFEKAKNSSIVESMRHADYWVRQIHGDQYANEMQNNRNERGNINGYVY